MCEMSDWTKVDETGYSTTYALDVGDGHILVEFYPTAKYLKIMPGHVDDKERESIPLRFEDLEIFLATAKELLNLKRKENEKWLKMNSISDT